MSDQQDRWRVQPCKKPSDVIRMGAEPVRWSDALAAAAAAQVGRQESAMSRELLRERMELRVVEGEPVYRQSDHLA
jgi:hypothetical protein